MMPLQTSANMIPLQTSASMMPLHTSANMIPLQTSESMIPLQTSASMMPLSSVDVVIGFLLEVERLVPWSSRFRSSCFFNPTVNNFAIRFLVYQPVCHWNFYPNRRRKSCEVNEL
jgi:hypothetical protein